MRILKNKYTWIGFVGGMVVGPWALNTLARTTGVSLSLPTVGSK